MIMSPSTLFSRNPKRDAIQVSEKRVTDVKPSAFRLYPISSRKKELLVDRARPAPKRYEHDLGVPRHPPPVDPPALMNQSESYTPAKGYALKEPREGWPQAAKESNGVDNTDALSDKRAPAVTTKRTDMNSRQTQGLGGLPIYAPSTLSSKESILTQESPTVPVAVSLAPLQPRQPDGIDVKEWDSLDVDKDDFHSYELVSRSQITDEIGVYKIEKRSELLFSEDHLKVIFDDSALLAKFTGFLNSHRPSTIPILSYYLDAVKALRAISYANDIVQRLQPTNRHQFTERELQPTKNAALEEQAQKAFIVMVNADLPAYISHQWAQTVRIQIERRIAGTLSPHLREASEGLAEVFCLTDPHRPDNPVILASEAFSTVTQYGLNYSIGRNCRFLQGPKSDPRSVRRISEACRTGRPITEVFLNYHRDGSPFMNMLTIAPLMDEDGGLKYFLGSQIEVSGLAEQCTGLAGLAKLVEKRTDHGAVERETDNTKERFESLCEMFDTAELHRVRQSGGRMYKEYSDDEQKTSQTSATGMSRLILTDQSQDMGHTKAKEVAAEGSLQRKMELESEKFYGKVENIYEQWLIVRPVPSLRILFTSSALQQPGILQADFFNYIGSSDRVRQNLKEAMTEGRGVTAQIRWLTQPSSEGGGEGSPRWIHCTPLLDHKSSAGAWVIILVKDSIVSTS